MRTKRKNASINRSKLFDGSNFVQKLKQFEEENYFLKWYDAQPASAKVGLYGAAIIALLTHITIYSNWVIEGNLQGFRYDWSLHFAGRWFQRYVNSLNFFYMNWVTGLLQVFVLAVSVFMIIKAFEIKNRMYALLIAGIMVTFPALAESNLYAFSAAPIAFAIFFSMSAFYVTKQHNHGFIIGAFLVMLVLAIYQSYIGLVMILCLVNLIVFVTKENPKFAELVKYACRFLFLIVGGLAAYQISLLALSITITHHRMHLSVAGIIGSIRNSYWEVFYYFFYDTFRIDNNLLTFIYGFIALTSMMIIMAAIRKGLSEGSWLNSVVIIVLVFLLPIAANFSRMLDSGSPEVLRMSSYAFAVFLILPVIFYENFKANLYGLKKITVIALVIVVGYNISFANFLYLRGQVYMSHAVQLADRIMARAEPLLPYSYNNYLFVHGNVIDNPIYPHMHSRIFPQYTPRATTRVLFGGNNDHTSWVRNVFNNMVRYRVGLHVNVYYDRDHERRASLIDRAITLGMPVYPQEGSVAVIDGVVVAMLNFFGRVDVYEVFPHNFFATVSHTGMASNLGFNYTWYLYRDGTRISEVGEGANIVYEITEIGYHQFRVFVALVDGRNVINVFSQAIRVD